MTSRQQAPPHASSLTSRVTAPTSRDTCCPTVNDCCGHACEQVYRCCRTECADGRQRTSWLIGLSLNAPVNSAPHRLDIRSILHDFKGKCETWTGFGAGMTLEIKEIKFRNLPDYLAVYGRVAVPKTVHQEQSPPTAPASAVEKMLLTDQKSGSQSGAQSTAATPVSDTKMESENADKPLASAESEDQVHANMQGDQACCAAVAGGTAGEASVGGWEQAIRVGTKRMRDAG